jgi:hypothetical protein
MLVQFLYMQVSIDFACCIVADDMGPISRARISTVPAVKTFQWIYQTASDSLESINFPWCSDLCSHRLQKGKIKCEDNGTQKEYLRL